MMNLKELIRLPFWQSTRWRLFALVLISVLPALAVLVIGAWWDLQQDLSEKKQEVSLAALQAQRHFGILITNSNLVFTNLIRPDELIGARNCTQIYDKLRFSFEQLAPEATNLSLSDAEGNIYCAIHHELGETNVFAQPHFQRALQSKGLSLDNYVRNSITDTPMMSVAYPVATIEGEVQIVINANYELWWLEQWLSETTLPPQTALTLISLDQEILQRWVDGSPDPVQGNLQAVDWSGLLENQSGVLEATDLDGEVRLNTLAPLEIGTQRVAFLHVGFPVYVLYSNAYQSLAWKLALVGVITLSAFLLGWWVSEKLFLKPLKQVKQATSLVQAGDLSVRVAPVGGVTELIQLAQSFDQMTISLQQREADRQQSEARFRAMFETSAVGIGIMSLDRKIIDANPAMCRMFGRTAEEFIGQTPATATFPEDYPKATQSFEDLLSGKRNFYIEERRFVRKNGEIFWAHVTMSIVRDANQKPLYMVGMVMDIDEQKKTHVELEKSEERFRAIFENAAIGISLISPDQKVLSVNPTLSKISGYTEGELMNLGGPKLTYEEDKEVGLAELKELLTGKLNSYQVEKRYIHKNGHIKWMRQTISGVRDSSGNLLYFVAIAEDIDEHKRALDELRESEARFRAIFDSAAVGMAMMSLDRHVMQINQSATRITGYSHDELLELNPIHLAVEEDRYLDQGLYNELVTGVRDQYVAEKRYIRKDGSIFWGRINFALVRGKNSQPLYIIGMIEDITDEKRAAERLALQDAEYRRTLEQRISERTAELNQANSLLQQKATQEAVIAERTRLARDLHDAVTQTLFSATLISDVLPELWEMNPDKGKTSLSELSQLTRGALAEMRTLLVELRPNALIEVPLPTLLRQLAEAITGRARLQVELHVEGERKIPPEVQVGLYRITQEALNNIVKHAKATQAVVTLLLNEPVRLTVADNGISFDPSTVTADHLGLKIMRERAGNIGATFTIYSEPGEGTQISVLWE
jgi:PAS domain S-box-containing protein